MGTLGLVLAGLPGCGLRTPAPPQPIQYDEALFAGKPHVVYEVPVDVRDGRPHQTVIGVLRRYRVRDGDTFLDVARLAGLGFNELIEANPGVDPWVPPAGTDLLIPTRWVLPCCRFEGVVVNVPEMRLFRYERSQAASNVLRVYTYPVGIGRVDRPTPRGRFHVGAKDENPTWVIPESIRREHISERGDARRAIAGGDPENPLGRYRLSLSGSRYAIHGTNIPWGPGMPVSHGCLRLYPEDIERLYPRVDVGEPVTLVYQPVKVGVAGDRPYVEVHDDVYRRVGSLASEARHQLSRSGLAGRVDGPRLAQALAEPRGIPVPITGR